MASNQTEHYSLNQWQLSDSVVMADFNADNQKLDAELSSLDRRITAAVADADQKVNSALSTLNKRIDTAVANADQSVDSVLSTLNKRIDTAVADADQNVETVLSTLNSRIDAVVADVTQKTDSILATTTQKINTVANTAKQNLDNAIAAIGPTIPHVYSGSYVGTGTYGIDNPNSLTFDFTPKLLIISQYAGDPNQNGGGVTRLIAIRGVSETISDWNYSDTTAIHLIWEDKKVSWYHSKYPRDQGNCLNVTYHYLVIG